MTQQNTHEMSSRLSNQSWERELLALARSSIETYISTGMVPVVQPLDPHFREPAAVFVTLRTHSADPQHEDELRGCVGQVEAREPLSEAVQDAAIQAAISDPRFRPVQEAELPSLRIEISILSPLTLVTDLRDIEISRHGLVITGLGRRGLLLPSVPEHYGWDRATFLAGLCDKAGLPHGVWPAQAKLYSFTARHFSE